MSLEEAFGSAGELVDVVSAVGFKTRSQKGGDVILWSRTREGGKR